MFLLLTIGLVIRLISAPFGTDQYDFGKYAFPTASILLEGGLLYIHTPWNHVPLYAFICTGMTLLGRGLEVIFSFAHPEQMYGFLFKLPIIFADTIIALLLHQLVRKRMNGTKTQGLISSALYYLNPVIILETMHSRSHALPTMFVLLSVKLLLQGKNTKRQERLYHYVLSGLVLGLSFLLKETAVLAMPILMVAVLEKREIKQTIGFIASCGLTIIGGIAPFLVAYPKAFFEGITSHPAIEHTSYGISFWEIIHVWSEKLWGITIANSLLNGLALGLTAFLCLMVILIVFFKRTSLDGYYLFTALGAITIGWVALFKTNHIPYYILFIPFLLPLIFRHAWFFAKRPIDYKIAIGLGIITLMNLLHQLSFMIYPGMEGSETPLGAITAVIYNLSNLVVCGFVLTKFLQIKEEVEEKEQNKEQITPVSD